MARVLAGDVRAFEGIVRRWQRPLLALALRFCRDRALAEDLAQEAFLRAFRALGQWRGEAAFGTWLLALSMNAYRSALRARARPLATTPLDSEVLAALAADSGEPPESGADERVRRAVTALPPRYRDAVIAYYFRGMDVKQAAQWLGVREGTLKARLSRARSQLGRMLAPVLPRPPTGRS